ncbi:MAG: hypothetical protein K9H16_15970 [Bacteroidales bacterium]|nr:hypothetical protein [Bacteroidales bacterium]
MEWYFIFAIAALFICTTSLLFHLIKVISLGKPQDFSSATGSPEKAMPYAFVGAMSPAKKESAFLYLPTYVAGIIYHLGTFTALVLFFFIAFKLHAGTTLASIISAFLAVSGLCGFGILIKRIVKSQMRELSNPDDYISNLLVSVFHWVSALVLLSDTMLPVYFVISGLLFLYIPLGKLKHTIYFFAARYHLGFFFGRRGVWPPK